MKYPYARPEITLNDERNVISVLKNGYLTQGYKLVEFERELAKVLNCKYVVVCNSGTAALHMVYSFIGLDNKNALVTSPLSFVATSNAALMNNAEVIFCDVDETTGIITAEEIEKKIISSKKKIKAICVVHLTGRVAKMKEIKKIAKKYKCVVIEDACHALGAFYKVGKDNYKPVGSCHYSMATTFSFHAIKHVAMGEGGCIATNNKKLAEYAKNFLAHGINRDSKNFINKEEKNSPWYYEMTKLGYNYKADELTCSLGLSQLKRLKKNIYKRKSLVKVYNKCFNNINYIKVPKIPDDSMLHAWHLYSIQIDFKKLKISRAVFMKKLLRYGIGTQVHYIPINRQPYYRKIKSGNFRNANDYYNKTISLPLHTLLNSKDINYIAGKVIKILKKLK